MGAFVQLMLAAVVLGQTGFNSTRLAWGSLLFQSLVVSFASFLVWFWLLRNYLASRLGVFSFMTPLFGMAFGVWLLNEPLELSSWWGPCWYSRHHPGKRLRMVETDAHWRGRAQLSKAP